MVDHADAGKSLLRTCFHAYHLILQGIPKKQRKESRLARPLSLQVSGCTQERLNELRLLRSALLAHDRAVCLPMLSTSFSNFFSFLVNVTIYLFAGIDSLPLGIYAGFEIYCPQLQY